ncbi:MULTISPECIES: hypothetical protein [Moorena]|nr:MULTISPECIES: hypothetical protein [Moorena]
MGFTSTPRQGADESLDIALDTPRSKDAGILRSTTRLAASGRNQEQ